MNEATKGAATAAALDDVPALDERQRAAVGAPPGPLLILAGAGSGKTRVLTERAARHLALGEPPAAAVLVITFTNRAADELRTRLRALVGEQAEAMTIGTFHAVCHRMLRQHAWQAGRSPAFSIYDAQASRRVLADELRGHPLRAHLTARVCADQIGHAKARLIDPAGYRELASSRAAVAVAEVWERYEQVLAASDALDFDELLVRAVALLGDPELRAGYRQRWRAVLVDEYQDTNPAQHEWLRRLAGDSPGLTVVGDDDQAIYRWRGAEVAHILRFAADHRGARVVALERNWRSSGAIVAAAVRLVAHNPERHHKTMWTPAPEGVAVTAAGFDDVAAEARAAGLWARTLAERGVDAGRIAVLFRTRGQAQPVEDALLECGLGCRLVGVQGLWESAAVRDLVAHLTLLVNPRDRVALARALGAQPGIGKIAVARVLAAAERHGGDLIATCLDAARIAALRGGQAPTVAAFGSDVSDLAAGLAQRGVGETVIEATLRFGIADGLRIQGTDSAAEQLERLRRFARAARRHEDQTAPGLAEFLAHAALGAGDGDQGEGPGLVTLSTLHAAKGGEWDYVRIVGVCEGLLPHARSRRPCELAEERRLAYVGMTRARRELTLTFPRSHRRVPVAPSRFIAEAGIGRLREPRAPRPAAARRRAA